MTRILLLCGSQRRHSLNARLLDVLQAALPPGATPDRLRPEEVPLPLFNAEDEGDPAVQAILRPVHARFHAADALIVASPEYNGMMTPFLKNLIDWVSRLPRLDPAAPNAFLDRPVLLASASPGWSGGAMGIPPLRALLGHVGALPFGETITLPYADQAWRADGSLNPDFAGQYWPDCLARFCALAARVSGERA